MKKHLTLRMAPALLLALSLWSCSADPAAPDGPFAETPAALEQRKAEIDNHIVETVRQTGRPFNWNEAEDALLFDALRIGGGTLVVGYGFGEGDRSAARNELIALADAAAHRQDADATTAVEYENTRLGYFYARVDDLETLQAIRNHPATSFVEVRGYPFDVNRILAENTNGNEAGRQAAPPTALPSEMMLDPQSATPYPDQVAAFDGGLTTVIRRHNMAPAYTESGVFGDGIGVAIIDNGLLPERNDFFYNNGYGDRRQAGYYNPLWFLPWTNPDGNVPRPTDLFGLSQLLYTTYYNHGSEMVKMVLTLAPNANIQAVRASTWTVIIAPSQVLGIANAIMAAADDPEIRMVSMSMGTIFAFNEITAAIEYFHSKGKLFVCSAGSTAPIINQLLGVLYPGVLPQTVTVTALENREETGGEFIVGEGSHGGPENDFAVENTYSSSVACSRGAGMIALVWSANPAMDREELMDVLIGASYFYQQNGQEDPFFGWGPIDVGRAVELAQGG